MVHFHWEEGDISLPSRSVVFLRPPPRLSRNLFSPTDPLIPFPTAPPAPWLCPSFFVHYFSVHHVRMVRRYREALPGKDAAAALFTKSNRQQWRTNLICNGACRRMESSLSPIPGGSDGKESACQCRKCGLDPWVGKIPWRRKWQPTPVFLSGKSHGQRSLVGCSP